jgi:hypothetical protein
VGDVVKVVSDVVGGRYQVAKVDITDSSYGVAMGVIIEKSSSLECVVQLGGQLSGVYSGLTAGQPLFVGDDSRLTHSVPTRPAVGVKLVYNAALALDSDELFLRFHNPIRMRAM